MSELTKGEHDEPKCVSREYIAFEAAEATLEIIKQRHQAQHEAEARRRHEELKAVSEPTLGELREAFNVLFDAKLCHKGVIQSIVQDKSSDFTSDYWMPRINAARTVARFLGWDDVPDHLILP